MDKIKFNKLNIPEQLIYINDKLKEGSTLTITSKNINVSRKTIGNRFIAAGYVFNKDLKQYIKNGEYKSNTNILQVAATSVNKEVSKREYKSNTNIFNSKEAKDKILNILEKHDDIEEMLNWYHNQRNVIEVDLNELKINSDKLHGDVKITTVRLYAEVWEQFRSFMGEHNEFKNMDLVSMALIEYIEKYHKE